MNNERKIKIIIVDDNKSMREALKYLIAKNKDWYLLGEAENGQGLIDMPALHEANIVLLDLEMPILNGLETARYLTMNLNKIKIIAITMYTDRAYFDELIAHGFHGFIYKTQIFDELETAINNVMANKYFFPKELLKLIKNNSNL